MKLFYSSLMIIVLLLNACGSSQEPILQEPVSEEPVSQESNFIDVPDWYNDPPDDDTHTYISLSATSRDMQLAVDKALSAARVELAAALRVQVSGTADTFRQELGLGEDSETIKRFRTLSVELLDEELRGARARNKAVRRENGIYRAFVLVEMPIGASSEAMVESIRNDETLRTQFEATRALEELENDIEELRELRRNQQN